MADTNTEKSAKPARVLIIAGYASVRAGLHALLTDVPDLDVRGDAPPVGDALVRLLPALRPDVILLDTTGEGGTTDPTARLLAALSPLSSPPALVVISDNPARDLPRLSRAGLPGWAYLLREADSGQIAGAVRAVATGLVVLDPGLPLPFAEESSLGAIPTTTIPGETLTPRETEVLQLMAEGLPNKIIASRLGISLHTAKFHVAQILGKLDATSRTEAVTIGARRGYVLL